jgi:tetratricopeptide (TPR) repeat protein
MKISSDNDEQIQGQLGRFLSERDDNSISAALRDAGEFFEMEGDLPRALSCLSASLDLEPNSALASFLRARCLLRQGHYRKGGKELEACSEMDSLTLASRSWHDNNLYYIGYALFNVGQYKEAAEAFRGAQNLINIWFDPLVLKKFHFHQGQAWHAMGDYLAAGECYLRGLIAPGPGDSCDEDLMEEAVVESAQDFNDTIEPFYKQAQACNPIDESEMSATPAFP